MAITWIQNKAAGNINGGAVTLTFDAGLQQNDLVIMTHAAGDNVDLAMPAPTTAGYTDVGTSELYANGSSNDCNSKVWYKYMGASPDANVVAAGSGGGSNSGTSAACMVFRGVATAAQGGPFSTAAVTASGTGSTSADPASIATAAGDWVVACVAAAHAATVGTATAPANYTTNANAGDDGADSIASCAAMAYRASGLSNPENPGAFTFTATAAGDAWTAVTLALKEAPAASPGPAPFSNRYRQHRHGDLWVMS